MTDQDAVDIAVRAYEMYMTGDLNDEQAEYLFGDQYEKVRRMERNDEIVKNTPDADPENDELFFNSDEP